jgi:hypothetical protein
MSKDVIDACFKVIDELTVVEDKFNQLFNLASHTLIKKDKTYVYRPGKYLEPGELNNIWFESLKPCMPSFIKGIVRIISQYSKPRYEYTEELDIDYNDPDDSHNSYEYWHNHWIDYYTEWDADYFSVQCGYVYRLTHRLSDFANIICTENLVTEFALSQGARWLSNAPMLFDRAKKYIASMTHVDDQSVVTTQLEKYQLLKRELSRNSICFDGVPDIVRLKNNHHCAFFHVPISVNIVEDNGYRIIKTDYDTESG